MSQETVEIVRSCIDRWNRGDFDWWMRRRHPDAEFHSSITRQAEGDEGVWRGTEEVRCFVAELQGSWEQLSFEVPETRDVGDSLVALGTAKIRGRASGVALESPIAYVFEFDGGLVRKTTAYLDHAEALKAVGLEE
jgi:ketosteroid isomerase-like protein